MTQPSRPDWVDAALAKHVDETERAKSRKDRARLQAALRSDRRTDRDAARTEMLERAKPAKKTPAKKGNV